jgi:hypothetical protein
MSDAAVSVFEITNWPIRQAANFALRTACGEVAQLVEHTTENRSVDSSILSLATKS